jgi:hypothetical protein
VIRLTSEFAYHFLIKGQLQEDAITFTFWFSNHTNKVNSNRSGFIHKAESEDFVEWILFIGCFKPHYSMHNIAICDKITYGATADDNLRGRGGGKTLYRDSYSPL